MKTVLNGTVLTFKNGSVVNGNESKCVVKVSGLRGIVPLSWSGIEELEIPALIPCMILFKIVFYTFTV